MKEPKIVVVGGGLAGLMATVKAVEAGATVDLISIVPVKRSHSVCAQGGINGAVNTKGEGDSPWQHFDDTIYGGDFLANQPPVKAMCEAAPSMINLLDRMGVMFNRTPEGLLDFRRFGGTKHHRTAFAGATTGQQLLYALDEQARREEAAGNVNKFEGYETLSLLLDSAGQCRGVCAMDLRSMSLRAFPADAVIFATGGIGAIFGNGTNSVVNTGSASSAAFQQGAYYANGEFIQVHPTAIGGEDKLRLMSESARGEGGRVWVPKDPKDKRSPGAIPDKERFYFLEEWYPAYGNLVPRDIATRAIHKVVYDLQMGVEGKWAYLDLTHLPVEQLDKKLGGILEIYEKFVGEDPRKVPMKIFPAMHYTMGGLWVDYSQMTNIPGLFAAGECEYQYHGANRLGANALLACLYAGSVAGPNAVKYAKGLKQSSEEIPASEFDAELNRQKQKNQDLISRQGNENLYQIWKDLGHWMTANVTIVRHNDKLRQTDEKLIEMEARLKKAPLPDSGAWSNMALVHARELENMLALARVITLGALRRDESRGAHYKPEFPKRDDKNWLKTTKARFSSEGPQFEYEEVDVSLIPLRERKYDVDSKAASSEKKA